MAAKRKTTRRDFLVGRSAWQAVSPLPALDEAADSTSASTDPHCSGQQPSAEKPQDRSYLIQVGRDAMACEFQVLLNAEQEAAGTDAAIAALDLLEPLEQQLSVFRSHSEINHINRTAAQHPVAVERHLFELIQQSVELYKSTDGAFDITSGPLWKTWGFHHQEHRLPTQQEIDSVLAAVGTRWLKLDAQSNTIAFARPGLELNLGAIGKGYALDCCAELLTQRDVEDFVIHGGQSSMLARGSRMDAGAGDGWTVTLRHPLRHDQKLAHIRLRSRALGTSGCANQFFHFDGRRYGHVIDPRTGFPAEGILSATVLASSATRADALATAFFVMGPEQSLEYCAAEQDLAAILVCPGERSGEITIRTYGLCEDDWLQLC